MFEGIDTVLYNAIVILANEWGYELNSKDFFVKLHIETGITIREYLELMNIEEKDLI